MDTIIDQWPWFAAALFFIVLIAALASYYFYKPKAETNDPIPDQQKGWTPTGRIDFTDPHSAGNFILQVEETRCDNSIGGVEHRLIRWRIATLDEAKSVIVSYHAQRNLTMRPTFVVTSRNAMQGQSYQKTEHQEAKLVEDAGPAEQLEGRPSA